jgi:hypothetical protein
MSDGLGLSSRIGVFPCPNCKETINTSMQVCSFCSAPIDPAAAAASAEAFARVNQACSDASYLKIMAGSAFTFYLLRFVPVLNLMGIVALWFLEAAIPLMTIRWWAKFGDLRIDDPGFARARRTALHVGVGVAVFLFLIALGVFRVATAEFRF